MKIILKIAVALLVILLAICLGSIGVRCIVEGIDLIQKVLGGIVIVLAIVGLGVYFAPHD